MDANPPESVPSPSDSPQTHAGGWLVCSGALCLVLAGLCLLAGFAATTFGMLGTFSEIRAGTEPVASEMARQFDIATIPTLAVVPLGILGIVLLILGLVLRRLTSE